MTIKQNISFYLLLVIVLSFVSACKSDVLITVEELDGKWELIEAKRDRKITKTLKGTYFLFKDGLMTNNITESEKMVSFELKANRLVTRGDETHYYYVLKRMGDTILLNTKIQSNKFDFLLTKEGKDGQ